MKSSEFRIFLTKPFTTLRNLKKGFLAEGSYHVRRIRTSKGFVDLKTHFLDSVHLREYF